MTFELHNESWLQVFQVEKWLSIRGNFMLQWTFLFVILGICQGCCKTSYNAQTVPTAKNSVQFSCWVISDSLWPHGPQHARPPCPSPTPGVYPNSCHRVANAIQPSHPLSSPSPPALNPSQHQGLFQWVSSSHQVAKVLEFSFNISPSSQHPGLISFRMDWLDLLAIQ